MAFLTFGEISKYAPTTEKIRLLKEASKHPQDKDVFLSHSSADVGYIPGVVGFLQQHGASVYVDNGDATLPEYTNSETGNILRSRVKGCPRFVLLVSENSKGSRWIPWELGLADGFKGLYSVALLPIAQSSTESNWVQLEYLGLYPRIVKVYLQGDAEPSWCVRSPKSGRFWLLHVWLKVAAVDE